MLMTRMVKHLERTNKNMLWHVQTVSEDCVRPEAAVQSEIS
jgi:hypothetical protein